MHIQVPAHHQGCIACGDEQQNPLSFKLKFQADQSGGVFSRVVLREQYQGYLGVLHGGVISTLLDSAMTHCLFASGIEAMTAELQVRFIKPIPVSEDIEVSAELQKVKRGIYFLSSQILCLQGVYATATAKFIEP